MLTVLSLIRNILLREVHEYQGGTIAQRDLPAASLMMSLVAYSEKGMSLARAIQYTSVCCAACEINGRGKVTTGWRDARKRQCHIVGSEVEKPSCTDMLSRWMCNSNIARSSQTRFFFDETKTISRAEVGI